MTVSSKEFPPLDSGYEDNYGPISLDVYEAARAIWPEARDFGIFVLHDEAAAFNAMMQASARVSDRMTSEGPPIENIQSYLLRTYKNLVAGKRKKLSREQPLNDFDESFAEEVVADLERKILLRELFRHMNNDERTLSQYLMFGYTYKEIAAAMEEDPDVLRKRFSRLKKKIREALSPAKPIATSD